MTEREKWEMGKEHELNFWNVRIPAWIARFNSSHPLPKYFKELIDNKKEVKILDIGAGACNLLGDSFEGVKVEIHPCDYLADEYNEMFRDAGLIPHTPVEKQDMENITYEDKYFDIVHCKNALDHCFDPAQAIKEMVRVCKDNGFIYLHHTAHEGKRLRYHGFHQWNIDYYAKENECFFWNQKGEKFQLSSIASFLKTRVKTYQSFSNIISQGKKV
jgi:ubiquinone/menaquinone biosynthesis C-methylase UbiE